jgi:hypothetical protein
MALIDDFIKNEESKMSWGDKLIMNYPKVRSTPVLTDTFQHLRLGKEKVIKPALWNKVLTVILLLFTGWIWLGVLGQMLVSWPHLLNKLSGLALATLLIFLLIRGSFLNKKYNFTITVDYEGIGIDNNKFYWTAIEEVYIMSRREGKRTNNYLLICKKDATIEKFDLFGFRISSRKLSTIIEYYRTGQHVS